MLRYLNTGERNFGLYPMRVYNRIDWEFYAVVKGKIGPSLHDDPKPILFSHRLWIFPPETAHGWRGSGSDPATIVVFHFGMVPNPLEQLIRAKGKMEFDLSPSQCGRISQMAASLFPHFSAPNEISLIHFKKALLDLTLMVLAERPERSLESRREATAFRVKSALSWYASRIKRNPNLPQVARKVGVSVSHLRRMFMEVRRESPHRAFLAIKMESAADLLSQSDLKIDAVALESGFSSSIDFCRAFRKYFGMSPARWRKTRIRPYPEKKKK